MYDRKQLQQIQALSREPFHAPLDLWLRNAPSDEDVRAFAKKAPDRWAQGIAILSRQSGYTEKVEVDASSTLLGFAQAIAAMSDAELIRKLAEQPTTPPALDQPAQEPPNGQEQA